MPATCVRSSTGCWGPVKRRATRSAIGSSSRTTFSRARSSPPRARASKGPDSRVSAMVLTQHLLSAVADAAFRHHVGQMTPCHGYFLPRSGYLPDVRASEKAYYERRAPEYDDWWLGTGLFAERDRPGWDAEVAELIELIAGLPALATLDVGCGTAFLTRHLKGELTALDQSEAMLAIAAGRLPGAQIVCADVPPLPFDDASFGRVFTSHVYGHFDDASRAQFVREARRVAGELGVGDSGGGDREELQERVLKDGSRHEVFKRWFSGPTLAAELGGGEVLLDGDWFVVVRA